MNFKTGQVAWKNRSVGKGSVVFADKRIYALGENGTVGLIEPSDAGGWRLAWTLLAAGPVVGIIAMAALRRRPDAELMASGHR